MKAAGIGALFLPKVLEKSVGRFVQKLGPAAKGYHWLLLPISLLFVTLQVSAMKICCFTSLLPLIALSGFFLTLFYRTWGLALSYCALFSLLFYSYQGIDQRESLWQMGILFTLAVEFFITLLMIERMEEEELYAQKKAEEREKELFEVKEHFIREEEKYNEYIDSLKETVRELTSDLEQRRIDKAIAEKQFTLVQSEIALLSEQKQSLINDAFEARAEAKENVLRIETLLENESTPLLVEDSRKVAEIEGRYKQLRKQFEEKSQILDKTRIELFATETKLQALQREQGQITEPDLFTKALEREFIALAEELVESRREVVLLEQLATPSDKATS